MIRLSSMASDASDWPEYDPTEEWERDASGDYEEAATYHNGRWRRLMLGRPVDGARRRKLFTRAAAVLIVAAKVRGHDERPDAWYTRSGRRAGLFIRIDPDHEMHWTPRRGYSVVECVDIPF